MTLPTGGTVGYVHSNFVDSAGTYNRWVTSRTSGSGTWNFSQVVGGTCASGFTSCQQVTVTKPSSDQILYTFGVNNGAWTNQAQYYTGSVASGTLLKTVASSWDTSNSCPTGCTGSDDIRRLSETTTVPVPGGTNISTTLQYSYDNANYGNLVNISQWKYYTGTLPPTPGPEDSNRLPDGFELHQRKYLE